MTAFPTLRATVDRLRVGDLSPEDVWRSCSLQIERLNSRLNAFITVLAAGSQGQAEADFDLKTMPLPGIPVAAKDLIETAGIRTTAGTKFFEDRIPDRDATVITRVKAAGGRIIGKTNTHEIALGVTTVNPHFGTCHNPWDEDRIAGGSSGGSAVAVATGMVLGALGTDTGGSIRIPASLCGVVGLKPTYGRVSLRGVVPLSWNLDHCGPLARGVPDAALLLQVLAGYDMDDPSSSDMQVDDFSVHLEDGIRGIRFGVLTGAYIAACDAEIASAVEMAAASLEALGGQVSRLELPELREAALANGLMTQADAAAFHRERLAKHPDWFGEDVRRRLEAGRDTTAGDYALSRRAQSEIRRKMAMLFGSYDILLLPTTPVTAPLISGGDAVEHARQLTRFTAPFNLTGLPAISIMCGFDSRGLPIGMQLVAAWWQEALLLRAARAYEREKSWGERRPTIS